MAAAIPAQYEERASLVATGNQWLNTGYVPQDGDVIEYKGLFNKRDADNTDQALWCSFDSGTSNRIAVVRISTKYMRYHRLKGAVRASGTTATVTTFDCLFNNAELTAALAGGETLTLTAGDFTTDGPLVLLAAYDGDSDLTAGTGLNNRANATINFVRVFNKSGVLVRNYVPVRDTAATEGSVEEYGLYETVVGAFVANGGTVAFTAGATSTAHDPSADRHIVTAGDHTLAAPCTFAGWLYNYVTGKSVRFDQTASAVDLAHALRYGGFEAVGSSRTTFDGGYWDFGAASLLTLDASSRTVTLDGGAVVTNVTAFTLAKGSGVSNTLKLEGASALHVGSLQMSSNNGATLHENVLVSDGSLLRCSGNFLMSAGKCGSDVRYNTANRLVVSNAETRLVVGGLLGIGYNANENYGGNPPGGNVARVTDHALADLKAVYIGGGGNRCFDNRLVVDNGGVVLTKTIGLSSQSPNSKCKGWSAGDAVRVLDGGIVTNTGTTTVGYYWGNGGVDDVELVVSNGTFVTEKLVFAMGQSATRHRIRISGPRAFFKINSPEFPFSGALGRYHSWIVENGARFAWPFSRVFSHNAGCQDNSIIVRTGGRLTGGLVSLTKNTSDSATTNMLLSVESEAEVAVGNCYIGNKANRLSISNATLTVYSNIDVDTPARQDGCALTVGGPTNNHGPATNDVCELWGDHPMIRATNTASCIAFYNGSFLRFHLPAAGYREGLVPVTARNCFRMKSGCAIEFDGLEQFGEALDQTPNGEATLLTANSFDIPADVLAATRASLPENFRLYARGTNGSGRSLVLRKARGFCLFVR